MAAGDEHGLTEDLYQQLIGRYVSTIEVLSKRIFAKDQYIAKLETENSQLETQLLNKTLASHDGEVYYGEAPPDVPIPKRKK